MILVWAFVITMRDFFIASAAVVFTPYIDSVFMLPKCIFANIFDAGPEHIRRWIALVVLNGGADVLLVGGGGVGSVVLGEGGGVGTEIILLEGGGVGMAILGVASGAEPA